ncbi:MAG: hypothetical protein HOE11_03185 [Candidatus Diapherotrites archaeon]|jgi:hypothetical protein|nr:hypothetical protein [Candidatus Diapherotrites archaeon]MBT4596674.1 hypothetical protein [Candidatus Diapherotrites archaeon]
MKKTVILILCILLISLFFGCTEEKNEPQKYLDYKLHGTWESPQKEIYSFGEHGVTYILNDVSYAGNYYTYGGRVYITLNYTIPINEDYLYTVTETELTLTKTSPDETIQNAVYTKVFAPGEVIQTEPIIEYSDSDARPFEIIRLRTKQYKEQILSPLDPDKIETVNSIFFNLTVKNTFKESQKISAVSFVSNGKTTSTGFSPQEINPGAEKLIPAIFSEVTCKEDTQIVIEDFTIYHSDYLTLTPQDNDVKEQKIFEKIIFEIDCDEIIEKEVFDNAHAELTPLGLKEYSQLNSIQAGRDGGIVSESNFYFNLVNNSEDIITVQSILLDQVFEDKMFERIVLRPGEDEGWQIPMTYISDEVYNHELEILYKRNNAAGNITSLQNIRGYATNIGYNLPFQILWTFSEKDCGSPSATFLSILNQSSKELKIHNITLAGTTVDLDGLDNIDFLGEGFDFGITYTPNIEQVDQITIDALQKHYNPIIKYSIPDLGIYNERKQYETDIFTDCK